MTILNLTKDHRCASAGSPNFGKRAGVCTACEGQETPGCFLVEQDGQAFGWSESNVEYERVGILDAETMKRLEGQS